MTNMKKTIINYLLAAGVILGMASCQKSVIEPLEGVFAAPVTVNATELVSSSVEKLEGKRNFAIELSAGADKVSMVLVANNYFLLGNTYSPADEAAAKNGNYIVGKTTVNGKVVESGSIIVTKSGDPKVYETTDVYKFDGMLFCQDGTAYNVLWSGNLAYEADPEPIVANKLLSAVSNVASGTKSVTLNLGTDGVSAVQSEYGTSFVGDGNYLAIDLYSADGYLHEGTYKASAVGGVIGEGEFGIGWDPGDIFGIGWAFTDWGTCWWTVANNVATAEKITEGTVTVTRKGNNWEIELKAGEGKAMTWIKFTGAVDALTPADAPKVDYVELSQFVNLTDYTGWGMKMIGIELATKDVTFTPGDWGFTYGGEGNYLKFEVYSEDGKLKEGTYKACATGGVIGEGEFGIGYDGQFGASGTCWYTLGEAAPKYVTDGTATVEVDGETYTITLESTVVNAQFVGKLAAE